MLSKFILKLLGWKIIQETSISKRSVVAVLPHTSYWDGILGFLAMRALKINYVTLAASWLFYWPLKYVMKYFMHAIPVKPNGSSAYKASLNAFKNNDDINLIICPEGTLNPVDKWPNGFFRIAKASKVNIDFAIFNYYTKTIYIISFDITNMDEDDIWLHIQRLCNNYAYAKYPEKFKLPIKNIQYAKNK